MEKKVMVGGKEILFRANGATPMKYRNAFKGCDIFKDLMKINEAREGVESDAEFFESIDMGMFERIAYVMSDAQANHISIEDWLSQFEMMDILTALPDIMELWEANADTQSIAKNTEAAER